MIVSLRNEIYSELKEVAANQDVLNIKHDIQIEDVHSGYNPYINHKNVLPFLSLPSVALIQFALETIVNTIQYLAVSVEMSYKWSYFILDIFEGLRVFIVNIQSVAYIVIVIFIICKSI